MKVLIVLLVAVAVSSCGGDPPEVLTFSCREVFFCAPGTQNAGNANSGCPAGVESADGNCSQQTAPHNVDATTKAGAESTACDEAAPDPLEVDCARGDRATPTDESCFATCD